MNLFQDETVIADLKEKLWRAERALELLEVILPEKVEQAKRIVVKIIEKNKLRSSRREN